MKKILLFIVLLLPFYVYAEDSCSQDDIQIESITLDSTQGNIEQTSEPNTNNNQVNLGLKMNVIDDNITYKVVIKNTSNQDYTFDQSSLSTDYLNYDITYEDDSDIVKAGESKTIYLKVHYTAKPSTTKLTNGTLVNNPTISFNLSKEVEPEEVKTIIEEVVNAIVNPDNVENPNTKDKIYLYLGILIISLIVIIVLLKKYKKLRNTTMLIIILLTTTHIVKAVCTCTLDINTELEIDAKEAIFLPGHEVNVKIKKLAGATGNVNFRNDDTSIKAIKHSEPEPSAANKTDEHIVSTNDSPYPIYMWFDNGTIYWWSEDTTPSTNEDSSYMFAKLKEVTDISGVASLDLTNTYSLNSMLYDVDKLVDITSLANWNVSNIEIISSFFEDSESLTSESLEALKDWDVSNVKDMSWAFFALYSVENLNALSNWNTSSLELLEGTFSFLYGIKDLDALANWDVSNVTSIDYLFEEDILLESLEGLKKWDVSNVTSMSGLMDYCEVLTSLDGLENWDVSNVEDFYYAFAYNPLLTDVDAIADWNISPLSSFERMFYDTPSHPEFTKVQGTWDSDGTFIPNS